MYRLTFLARWLYARNPSCAAHRGAIMLIDCGLACFICVTLNFGSYAADGRNAALMYATIPGMLAIIFFALNGYRLLTLGLETHPGIPPSRI